jgi:hypothetical protein
MPWFGAGPDQPVRLIERRNSARLPTKNTIPSPAMSRSSGQTSAAPPPPGKQQDQRIAPQRHVQHQHDKGCQGREIEHRDGAKDDLLADQEFGPPGRRGVDIRDRADLFLARLRIDAGRRFVEQQEIRVVDQRGTEAELLLHPARQLARRTVEECPKSRRPGQAVRVTSTKSSVAGSNGNAWRLRADASRPPCTMPQSTRNRTEPVSII